jgi:alanine racemase
MLLSVEAFAKERGLRGSRATEWMPSGGDEAVGAEAAQSFEDDAELCSPSIPKPLPESLRAGLAANLATVKGKLARGDQLPPKLMAVVKPPDGGLPAPPEDMAAFYETLADAPEAYGVESVTDAIAVRHAVQANKTVLVMYPQEVELARLLWAEAVEVAISSEAWVEAAAVALKGLQGDGKRLGVHLFVDTGMARTGAAPDDAAQIVAAVLRHSDVLELRGIMSHFCCTRGQWSYEWYGESSKRRLDASKLHQQQKQRVQAVFQNLSAQVASHRAASPSALSHRLLRHAAASDNVELGESEIFLTWLELECP